MFTPSRKLLLCLFLLLAVSAFAAVPTISNIATNSINHTSLRVTFDVSPTDSYVQVFVGEATATYDVFTSESYRANANSGAGHVSLSINSLEPSTLYYICPSARPNQDNDTDITSCATYETTATTTADVSHFPVTPTAPTEYVGAWPDTSSGYTDVTFNSSCEAASTVGPITYGMTTWTVTSGMTVKQAVAAEGYGARNLLPASCHYLIPPTVADYNGGVLLPTKAPDPDATDINDPDHRFIIFESIDTTGTDFPPEGTRIDPSFASKMANFEGQEQLSCIYCSGQCFYADSAGVAHHYAIRRIQCSVDNALTTGGGWGSLIFFGRDGFGAVQPNYNIVHQMYLHGTTQTTVGSFVGLIAAADKLAFKDSYMDNIGVPATSSWAVFLTESGDGSYTIENNYMVMAGGFGIYCESNAGNINTVCNDTVLRRNTLYIPTATRPASYATRQPIEFKRGHRLLVKGNLIDGSYADQNDGMCFFASGNADNDTTENSGVWDMRVRSNICRRAATVFDCMGVRPPSNAGAPDNAVNRTILLDNNWAYNLGYHDYKLGNGGGLVNTYVWHGPGCADVSLVNNTLGLMNSALTGLDIYPGMSYSNAAGGATLAEGYTWKDNIYYLNGGVGRDRILGDIDQKIASHPSSPVPDVAGTPAEFLDTFSVRLSPGTVTAYNSWTSNTVICGLQNPGGAPGTWSDMTGAECTTKQSGMPAGETYASGNTIAAREADVGYDPDTGRCSGCSGNGADIDVLYSEMGLVTSVVAPTPTTTTAVFGYTSPDAAACNIDVSDDSFATVFSRTADGGGSTARTPTVSGLASGTEYAYRIYCVMRQINGSYGATSENWPTSMLTEGTFTTLSGVGFGTRFSGGVLLTAPNGAVVR